MNIYNSIECHIFNQYDWIHFNILCIIWYNDEIFPLNAEMETGAEENVSRNPWKLNDGTLQTIEQLGTTGRVPSYLQLIYWHISCDGESNSLIATSKPSLIMKVGGRVPNQLGVQVNRLGVVLWNLSVSTNGVLISSSWIFTSYIHSVLFFFFFFFFFIFHTVLLWKSPRKLII